MRAELTNENNQGEIVYVLTNPEMPGLVKIGKTSRKEVQQRLAELLESQLSIEKVVSLFS